MLNLERFEATALVEAPFKHLVVRDFVAPDALAAAQSAYPDVPGPGSHPPSLLTIEGAFRRLMNALEGDDFRTAVQAKFGIDLTGRPTMYTVRGWPPPLRGAAAGGADELGDRRERGRQGARAARVIDRDQEAVRVRAGVLRDYSA